MRYLSVVLLFGLISCARYLNVAPLPQQVMTVSEELEYMLRTDQADRKKGALAIIFQNRHGREIIKRDAMRTERAYRFYQQDSLKTDRDKFNAGKLLIHANDSLMRAACYAIFEDLEKNGITETGRMNGAHWKTLVYK